MLTEQKAHLASRRSITSADGRLTLADAGPGDRAAVIHVFEAAFGRWPPFPTSEGAAGFFDWALMAGAHFQGRSALLRQDGAVVGAELSLRRDALIQGAVRPAQQGLYGALLPQHQAQGLGRAWTELGTQRAQDIDFAWGFTAVAQLNRLRPQFYAPIPVNDRFEVFVRVMDARRATDVASNALRSASYAGLALAGRLRRRRPETTPGLEIGIGDGLADQDFASFWAAASAPFDFIPVRSVEYLAWRFLDPRAGRFLLLTATERGRLVGYVAVRVDRPRAVVAELLTLPQRPDVARALLEAATTAARSEGSGAIEIRLPARHPVTSTLRRAGFVRLRGRSQELADKFHVSERRAPAAEFARLNSPDVLMHLMAGDSDLI